MMRLSRILPYGLLCALLVGNAADAGVGAGRYMKSENPFTIDFKIGYMAFDEGEVRETRRAYDTGEGQPDYSAFLSAYTVEELGFDDQYLSLGVTLEKQWRFITLQLNGTYTHPNSKAVAKMHSTASNVPADQRGYYIGVDEVDYNGKKYECMWIPDGTEFEADIQAALLEFKTLITPFHLQAGGVSLSPWVHFGIFGGATSYEIDAGPAEGTVWYEDPPKEYVVKGVGTSAAGLAVPEIGFGGELRFDFGADTNRPTSLVFYGDYSFMHFSGTPGSLGVNVESTRQVDFNFSNIRFGTSLEWPLSQRVDFVMGLEYTIVKTDITLDSVHRSEDEQDELSEKYDKYGKFAISQIEASAGFRF